jgi:hypothetical protein
MTLLRTSGLLLALAAATSAQADNVPIPKPGLWEMKMTMQTGQSTGPKTIELHTRQCLGQTSEKEAKALIFGTNSSDMTCSRQDIRKTADSYIIDAVCTSKQAGSTTTTHAEITGDLNSSYTVKSTSRTEGGKSKRQESSVAGSAKRAGDCPAGWKSGDVEGPDGKKFNMKDAGK